MNPCRSLRLMWLLAGLALAACSGSGSSGFDAGPSTENAAITQALREQRCIQRNRLAICPADTASPSAPTPALRIDTGLDRSAPIACVQPGPGAPCGFTLPFAPQGFPPDVIFFVAVRTVEPDSRWTIGAEAAQAGAPDASEFDAPVTVPAPSSTADRSAVVQIAILAFLDPPAPAAGDLAALADSGADFAFVTGAFTLLPEGPAVSTAGG